MSSLQGLRTKSPAGSWRIKNKTGKAKGRIILSWQGLVNLTREHNRVLAGLKKGLGFIAQNLLQSAEIMAKPASRAIEALDAKKPQENDWLGNILYKSRWILRSYDKLPLPTWPRVNAFESANFRKGAGIKN